MPTVFPLMRVASFGLLALSTAIAAEPFEKLALSSSEVNLIEIAAASSAAIPIYAAIYSGSSSDAAGREGLALLTGKLIERQAGDGFVVTVTRDMTIFDIVARTGRESRVRALSRAMLRPVFTAEAFEQVKKDALGEIESIRHDPARLAVEAFHAFVYRGHSYAHPAPGTLSGLEKITLEDMLAYHGAHYRKGNFAIAVPDASGGQLLAGIRSDFAALPDGEPSREPQTATFLPRPKFLVVESQDAVSGGTLLVGHPTHVTVAHPDYFSLQVALRGVVQQAGELLPSPLRQPAVVFSPGNPPDGRAPSLAALIISIREIATMGIPADRLETIRGSMRAQTEASNQSSQTPAISRLEEFLQRSPGLAARQSAALDQVTVESVQAAAARHLFAGRVAIIAVVPSSDLFVAEILASPAMKATGVALLGSGPTRNDFEILKGADLFR